MTHLQTLQNGIQFAEERYIERSEDNVLPFATKWQVIAVSILVSRTLTEPHYTRNPRKYVHRDIRLAVLCRLFNFKPEWFSTSWLISKAGAEYLIEQAFGRRVTSYDEAKRFPIFEDIVLAIQEAAEGLFEAKYPDGKVLRKTPIDRQAEENL